MINLTHNEQTLSILPQRGGLISSWKIDGNDLLYTPADFSALESSWPGAGIPTCFPFAGRVWNKGMLYRYAIDGIEYSMPLHGFLYGMPLKGEKLSPFKARLNTRATEASKVLYPFDFEYEASVTLISPRSFEMEITVTHLNHEQVNSEHTLMPVALGLHPYFRTGVQDALMLSMNSSHGFHVVTPSGAAGRYSSIDEFPAMPLKVEDHPLLKSLIFTKFTRAESLLRVSEGLSVKIVETSQTPHFNHMVVWSNDLNAFYCVEPWMSLPDGIQTPSGAVWLKKGERCSMKIAFTAVH